MVREKEDSLARLERIAFMSYARENNHDKYLSRLRAKLELAVRDRMGRDPTGKEFELFQDLVHVHAGHQWEDRVKQYLSRSTLLLPIITPHFYDSEWCRKEFVYFREKEQQTNRNPRILPVYYIECPQMRDNPSFLPDSMEVQLRGYQYADWRELYENATDINSSLATRTLRKIAIHIQEMFEELEAGLPASDDSVSFLLTRMKASAIDAAATSPFGTPFDLTVLPRPRAFFGRGSDLDWVIEILTAAPSPHVAALDGAEGIGKTAVAAEAINRLFTDGKFPGGIAVVPCKGLTDPRDVLRSALTRFDPERRPPANNDEVGLADEARQLLSKRQALIVLDDIETRLDITRVTEPLIHAGAALLLTSKRPLLIAKARRRTLAPLQISDALDLLIKPSEERRQHNAERD